MSDPVLVNKTAQAVGEVLERVFDSNTSKASLKAWVLVSFPALFAVPVLGPFLDLFLTALIDRFGWVLFKWSANASTKIIIDFQVAAEVSKSKDAFQNLQMAVASGDEYAIKVAGQDLDAAYGALIHSDGVYTP